MLGLLALLFIAAIIYLLAKIMCRKLWQTMVFLGIIVIFFSWLLVPALKRAHRSSQAANCINNIKRLGLAMHIYAQDYDGKFPENLFQLYPKYTSKVDTFFCPSTPNTQPLKEIKRPEDANISYLVIPSLTERDDKDIVLNRDKSMWNHGSGMMCCFIDGHVEWVLLDKYIEKDFDAIAPALQAFFKTKKRYPTNEEGLKTLVSSGYLRVPLFDPFDIEGKRPYGYAFDNVHKKWLIRAYGPDQKPDIDFNLFVQGKISPETLMEMKTRLIFGMMEIKRTNGDVFRVGP